MKDVKEQARARFIVALDTDSAEEALRLVQQTGPHVGVYKIGLQLFVKEGPELVRRLVGDGHRVFLDLKLHDIPNTVLSAARQIADLNVSFFTVHCLNSRRALATLKEGLGAYCRERNLAEPVILGVTVLTSMSDADLHDIGCQYGTGGEVDLLVGQSYLAGLRAFVASAQEAAAIKKQFPDVFVVTPGIRPAGSATDDQSRVMTPASAITAGADALVIGRPVTRADDPATAAQRIREEIAQALAG